MQASDNNRADTVEEVFLRATEEWGWPQRVRVDYGKENYGVWKVMVAIRRESQPRTTSFTKPLVDPWYLSMVSADTIKAPFIRGKSTSNTPIERHWKEVGEKFTHKYSRTFADLEYKEELDPDNAVDIFCLHHCFLPLLNLTIRRHVLAHNHHKSTTAGERGWTPKKKWLDGMLKAGQRGMDLNLYPTDDLIHERGFIEEQPSDDDGISEEDDWEENEDRPGPSRRRPRPDVISWASEQRLEDQDVPMQDTDPYVMVERYHEQLPPLLKDPDFRQALNTHFPPAAEHSPEEGQEGLFNTLQYVAVRHWVYDCILANQ
jgi:hypothetical protein